MTGRVQSAGLLGLLALLVAADGGEEPVLQRVAAYRQGDGAVRGLAGAQVAVLSPDGLHLYTAGPDAEGIAAFARLGEGRLEFLGTFDGRGEEGRPKGASTLIFSPDGRHLYVASRQGRLRVFTRDAENGKLRFTAQAGADRDGARSLAGAVALAASPDGRHLYVAASEVGAVAAFERDPESGALGWLEAVEGAGQQPAEPPRLTSLALSPDGGSLYAAAGEAGAVVWMDRDPTSGRLTLREAVAAAKEGPAGLPLVTALAASPDGRHLYAAGESPDTVSVLERLAGGRLRRLRTYDAHDLPGLALPFHLATSPDGGQLYVTGASTGSALLVLSRERDSGLLSPVEVQAGPWGEGLLPPPAVAVPSPDGTNLYAVLDGITVFTRDASSGSLSRRQSLGEGGGIDGLDFAAAVALSPDGRHLYTAGAGPRIGVFALAGRRGGGRFVHASFIDGLTGARALAAGADGNSLYLASPAGSLLVLERDPATGGLALRQTVEAGAAEVPGTLRPSTLALAPDQRHLYAASRGSIAVFRREGPAGLLRFAGSGSLPLAAGEPGAVRLSADGRFVYVAMGEILVLERDTGSGLLSPAETAWPLPGEAASASSLALGPEGRHLYADDAAGSAILVFDRDPATGGLRLSEKVAGGAGALELGAGGELLFAATAGEGPAAGTVRAFRRDPATGGLSLLGTLEGGGRAPLLGELSLAAGAGGTAYVTARRSSSLVVLGVEEVRKP